MNGGISIFYLFIGAALFLILICLLLADKFAPYSDFMSSFKKGTFKKLIVSLAIGGLLCVSYGIYYKVTYQPPFLDIQVNENRYTIFGDIGEIGYFADTIVREDEAIQLCLVTWEDIDVEQDGKLIIHVQYPSGKEETWTPKAKVLEGESISNLKKEHEIKEIFELHPFTFSEAGDVQLTINKNLDFSIEVNKN